MGRFAEKYPRAVKEALYRLVLDERPPLTVRQAREQIAQKMGVEIVPATAHAYVRDEKRRRAAVELRPITTTDPHDALDLLARRVIQEGDWLLEKIRKTRNMSPEKRASLLVQLGRMLKDLRASLEPRAVTKSTEPRDDEGASNGKGELARLLETVDDD
jgi:hypothetical protein